jgi:outer membrane protein TolC
MLTLASAGCNRSVGTVSTLPAATAPGPGSLAVPAAARWWHEAGDPILATLVEKGLDSSEEIACRVSRLRQYDFQVAQEAKRVGVRLGRLVGAHQKVPADARTHEERVQRIAARRTLVARQIATAYVEVRRLQQEVSLRSSLSDQYRDNAEVARFRREAGLVSASEALLIGIGDCTT